MITQENILEIQRHRPLLQHEWEEFFTHKGKPNKHNIEFYNKNIGTLGGFHQLAEKEDRTRTQTKRKDYASYLDKKSVPKDVMTKVQALTTLSGEKKARIRKVLEEKYGKRESRNIKEMSTKDMQNMKRKTFIEPILTAARYHEAGRDKAFHKRFASGVHEENIGKNANMQKLALKIASGLKKQGGGKIRFEDGPKLNAKEMKLRTHSENKDTFKEGPTKSILSSVLEKPKTHKVAPQGKINLGAKIGASLKSSPSMRDPFTKEHEARFDRENPNFKVRTYNSGKDNEPMTDNIVKGMNKFHALPAHIRARKLAFSRFTPVPMPSRSERK